MKVLMLMPYPPVPAVFGGAMRIKYLLKRLSDRHDVTVATFGTPEKRDLYLQEFGDRIAGLHMLPEPWSRKYKRLAQVYSVCTRFSYSFMCNYSSKMQHTINELLSKQHFDVVHSEFPFMAQYRFPENVTKIMDAHNVEYDNFRRMALKHRSKLKKWFYSKESRNVYREEMAAIQKQDHLLATSNDDIAIIKSQVPEVPAYVIPNGVDTSFFAPQELETEPNSLVFTGMMGYTPNADGILWFLDEIFPLVLKELPDTKIYIVGNRPPAELKRRTSDNVIVTGFVDDVRPFVSNARVFVVPLRMGSGTRLKVVEALAMKKPVVSTSIGCEGIEVKHGSSILIQDEPSEFAGAVIALLMNQKLGFRLAETGYELVTSVYDWNAIGDRMLEVYENIGDSKKEMPKKEMPENGQNGMQEYIGPETANRG